MPQTTLIESATYTTCVPHVARISNVESVLFGIREDLEGNSLEECVMDLLVTGTSICCFILIDLFSAGERTLYSERNPRRTPRPSLPQPRYTLTEIDKKRCQALTAKKNDLSPSCWWDYSCDVEGYWSWVESTGKDHVQSVFEKGVPVRKGVRFWFGLWRYWWTGRGYKYAQGNSAPLRLWSCYTE